MKLDVMAVRLTEELCGLVEANGSHFDTAFFKNAKVYSIDSTLTINYGKDANCIENPDTKFAKYTIITAQPGPANFLFFVAPNLFRYIPWVNIPPKPTTDFFTGLAEQMFKEKRTKLDESVANGTTDIIDRLLLLQRGDPSITDELLT